MTDSLSGETFYERPYKEACKRIEELEAHIGGSPIFADQLKPFRKLYQKYKHLDRLLSDGRFTEENFKMAILHDFWGAIKAAADSESKPQAPSCAACGAVMLKSVEDDGTCWLCLNCGEKSGQSL
jgi:hypothetical protein